MWLGAAIEWEAWGRSDEPVVWRIRPSRCFRRAAARLLRGPPQARRAVRPARLLLLSRRRASFDAARHGALPERVSLRRRAAHRPAQFRPAGLHAAALSPDPADRGNLHARPDERRALPVRHRQGHLADRDALLRRRSGQLVEDDDRGVRGADARAAEPAARFRRSVLQFPQRADRGRAAAEAASAAVVRRRHAAKRRAAGRDRHEHRHQRAGRGRAHADRALLEELQRERHEPREGRLHPPSRHRRHRRGGDGDRAARLPPLAGELHEALARPRHQAGRRDVSGRVRRRRHERPRHRGLAADGAARAAGAGRRIRARTTCCAAWRSAT